MTSTLAFALLAQFAGQLQTAVVPDSVIHPPGSPEYVFLPSVDATLSAVRVSVLFEEGPGEQGAGALLRELAERRVGAMARASGIEFAASRTPWGLSYTVVGPTSDFERIAEALRSALRAPTVDRIQVDRARRQVSADIEGEYETALGSLSRLLRTRLIRTEATLSGTPGSLVALEGSVLQAFWARTHARASLRVLIASPTPPELLFATLRELGKAGDPGPNIGLAPPAELPPATTQVLRSWWGRAFSISGADDPRAEVLALLISEQLEATTDGFGYETWVELRQSRSQMVLVVMGAAYADRAVEMKRRVQTVMGDVAGSIQDSDVIRVARKLARTGLEGARTPGGRVEFVGRHLDAVGTLDAASAYVIGLHALDAAAVAELARELMAADPVEMEIR